MEAIGLLWTLIGIAVLGYGALVVVDWIWKKVMKMRGYQDGPND